MSTEEEDEDDRELAAKIRRLTRQAMPGPGAKSVGPAADDFLPLNAALPPVAFGKSGAATVLQTLVDDSEDDEEEEEEVAEAVAQTIHHNAVLGAMLPATAGDSRPTTAAPVGDALALPSVTQTLERLRRMLGQDREALEEDSRALTKARGDFSAAQDRTARLREEEEAAAQEYEYFQTTRRWVSDLCGFLTAKQGRIRALERALDDRSLDTLSDLASRRAMDVLDEVEEAKVRGLTHAATLGTLPERPAELVVVPGAVVPPVRAVGMVVGPEARLLRRRNRYRCPLAPTDSDLGVLSDQELSETEAVEAAERVGEFLTALLVCISAG